MSVPGPHNPIRRATEADIDAIARTLATAFQDTHVAQWLIPDPAERAEIRPRQFAVLVRHAIKHGAVYTTTDHTAAMVWFDRTRPTPLSPDDRTRLTQIRGRWAARFEQLSRLRDQHQPTEPHHYIAFPECFPPTGEPDCIPRCC